MWLVEMIEKQFPLVQSSQDTHHNHKQPGNGSFEKAYSKARYLIQSFFSFLLSDMCGFFSIDTFSLETSRQVESSTEYSLSIDTHPMLRNIAFLRLILDTRLKSRTDTI